MIEFHKEESENKNLLPLIRLRIEKSNSSNLLSTFKIENYFERKIANPGYSFLIFLF